MRPEAAATRTEAPLLHDKHGPHVHVDGSTYRPQRSTATTIVPVTHGRQALFGDAPVPHAGEGTVLAGVPAESGSLDVGDHTWFTHGVARGDDAAWDPPTVATLRFARCDNVLETTGEPCTGLIAFTPTDPDAACDTCRGRCGSLVADYVTAGWTNDAWTQHR